MEFVTFQRSSRRAYKLQLNLVGTAIVRCRHRSISEEGICYHYERKARGAESNSNLTAVHLHTHELSIYLLLSCGGVEDRIRSIDDPGIIFVDGGVGYSCLPLT